MLLAVLDAKGAPGGTTAAVALALAWPGPVLLADCDPAGGDIAPGWLAGRAGTGRGLLSAVTATRHTPALDPATLAAHCVSVPEAGHLLVLPGLARAEQADALGGGDWARLAAALHHLHKPDSVAVDVIADCGRIGPGTPWPLLTAADPVLLACRPTVRGVHHARAAAVLAADRLGRQTSLGLLLTGAGPYRPGDVARAVGLPVRAALPEDRPAAAQLSDGTGPGRNLGRSALLRAARTAAAALHHPPGPSVAADGAR